MDANSPVNSPDEPPSANSPSGKETSNHGDKEGGSDGGRYFAEVDGEIYASPYSEIGRLRYDLAVEMSQKSAFENFARKFIKPFAQKIGKVGRDFLLILSRGLWKIGSPYIRGMLEEINRHLVDIVLLPFHVWETFRTRAYMNPVIAVKNNLSNISISSDLKSHVNFSWNYSRAAYYTKWGRRSKVYVGGIVLLSMYSLYHYKIQPWRKHDVKREISSLHKTVVITGSSAGIGYRLAYEFLKRGAFVIITSPDMVKARKARLDLSRKLIRFMEGQNYRFMDNLNVRYYDDVTIPYKLDVEFLLHNVVEMELNLASTASIYSFTRKIQGMSPQGIDILINNASVHTPPEEMVVTDEGKEVHFAVNYFGHFILTNLLMGLLAKRKGSRVINITCKQAAEVGFINIQKFIGPYLEEVGFPYLPAIDGYENSKLALYLFSRHLAKELHLSNISNVTTYCVCPGLTRTFIERHIRHSYFHSRYFKYYESCFHKRDYHAVQTILHCALSPKVAQESGFFYENNVRSILRTRHKDTDKVAESLWNASLALMGVGHNSMLKLTEQMHIRSNENIFQLGANLFLHRRDVMTHLLLMEEQLVFKNRHKKFINEMGDARDNFTYFWHGFYLTGGNRSSLLARWVLWNTHPGFRELQKEYDVWFECTGSSHYYPQANGKMAPLQYMNSMAEPLLQEDIEELEELYESDSEPDFDVEFKERFHKDFISMDEFIK